MQNKILICIPTYNERENAELIIPAITEAVPQAHILFIDDSSPDGTAGYVKEQTKINPNIHLLLRKKKQGLGKAYIAGFRWALERDYEFIFEMDADFSHDPKYLPDFLEAIKDADLVIGSRYIKGVNVINWPMSRLLLSYFANLFARIVTGTPIMDLTAGFKCYRKEVLESINLGTIDSSGYSFQIELKFLTWKNGFKITEIPIVFTDRQRGESKMSTNIIREGLFLVWKLRLLSLLHRKRSK